MNLPFVPLGWLMAAGVVPFVMLLLITWSILWQALALWHAARRGDKKWFIFFLFVHTAGIVELLYLHYIVHFRIKLPKSLHRS